MAACSGDIGSGQGDHYFASLVEGIDEGNRKTGEFVFDELGTVKVIREADVDRGLGSLHFQVNGPVAFFVLVHVLVDGLDDTLNKAGGFFEHFLVLHFFSPLEEDF